MHTKARKCGPHHASLSVHDTPCILQTCGLWDARHVVAITCSRAPTSWLSTAAGTDTTFTATLLRLSPSSSASSASWTLPCAPCPSSSPRVIRDRCIAGTLIPLLSACSTRSAALSMRHSASLGISALHSWQDCDSAAARDAAKDIVQPQGSIMGIMLPSVVNGCCFTKQQGTWALMARVRSLCWQEGSIVLACMQLMATLTFLRVCDTSHNWTRHSTSTLSLFPY